jgi:endo-1,4-beta-D-glucanase Y
MKQGHFLLILAAIFILLNSCNKDNTSLEPNRPFPQNISYASQYIYPNTLGRSQLNDFVANYYDMWKARYVKQCPDGSYYIDFSDEDPNIATVSEAIGYGMIIVAYMAGYDEHAKEIFDGLWDFYKKHPSENCQYFMAWQQLSNCQTNPNEGTSSATDGDEDVAYALLLADKQWGSNGKINYLSEAKKIITALKECAFSTKGYPLLGDWVNGGSPIFYHATRSSDWMPEHYLAFYNATNDNFWLLVNRKITEIIDSIQKNFSPQTGLIPDFIVNCDTSPSPAPPNFLESEYDGQFYYNACRTTWRLATGQLFWNDGILATQLDKINSWIINATNQDAKNIMAGYRLDGTQISDFQDIAFTGGFAVLAMLSNNQDWLNSCFTELANADFNSYTYYGNTLRMLYYLVLSGNYWLP